MNTTTPEVHIYASARKFVVVPLVVAPDCNRIEVAPTHEIPLTLGRPTTLRLIRAIRSAREFGESEEGATPARWDGNGGRWWQHHLMSVAIKWEATHVELLETTPGKESSERLPADTSEGELAEWLIQRLGQRLLGS